MRDVLDDLRRWYAEGTPFALATVVKTWKSAPRQVGASMAVSSTGEAVGSVSGGCVEGAVYALGEDVMADGTPRLQRYGVSDDDAFEVGLTCGGVLDVFVQAVDPQRFPELPAVAESIAGHEPVAVATVIDGPGPLGARLVVWPDRHAGTLGSERLDQAVVDDARGMLDHGSTGTLHLGPQGERRLDDLTVFVESFAPPPKMLVFGAIDFAAAVARIGKFLGYQVTVCDARPVFATPKRFPDADEVVVEWPHKFLTRVVEEGGVDERTVMCVLTHDPKFDVPLLEVALRLPEGQQVAYVGAMGSRRTHDDRMARLKEAGLTDDELARLSSPVGLDLGARTPEETAVSIAAEIIALRWGGGGERLGGLDG
ncbi:MAG: XdhC family protein, partial [Motilibacteraceae bacterium]